MQAKSLQFRNAPELHPYRRLDWRREKEAHVTKILLLGFLIALVSAWLGASPCQAKTKGQTQIQIAAPASAIVASTLTDTPAAFSGIPSDCRYPGGAARAGEMAVVSAVPGAPGDSFAYEDRGLTAARF